jgi:hypothetical protein
MADMPECRTGWKYKFGRLEPDEIFVAAYHDGGYSVSMTLAGKKWR